MPEPASGVIRWLRRIEDGVLVVLLTAMIGLAATQVLLRNLFDTGIYWGDSAVRVIVLWVAMVGAMVASRSDEHIRIDLVNHFLNESARRHVKRGINLFTCVVLGLFAWTSLRFVQYEFQDETIAFGNVPAWVCESIIPFGAFVMAVRYVVQLVRPLP